MDCASLQSDSAHSEASDCLITVPLSFKMAAAWLQPRTTMRDSFIFRSVHLPHRSAAKAGPASAVLSSESPSWLAWASRRALCVHRPRQPCRKPGVSRKAAANPSSSAPSACCLAKATASSEGVCRTVSAQMWLRWLKQRRAFQP